MMTPWLIISTLAVLALAIPAYWLTLRYNMHMFQLNVYMNGEQRAWIGKNFHLQWILVWAMCLGAGKIIVSLTGISWLIVICDILVMLTLNVIILVYRVMKEMNQKKKLVFTARVKRMVWTIIIISVLILLVAFMIAGNRQADDASYAGESGNAGDAVTVTAYGDGPAGFIVRGLAPISGVLLFLVGSQLWLNMLANTINKPIEKGVRNYYINDAKKILRSNPDLTIIGVTGSYGKTSVKFFLQTLLQQKYSVLVTPESYNTPMGVVITIRGQMKPSHQIFVCEMGARYVGEIKEICDIVHPQHGVITSIGPQHLDTFGSLANIQKTKFELADALPDDGLLFLNGDNEYIREYLDSVQSGAGGDAGGTVHRGGAAYDDPIFYHSEKIGEGYFASDISVSNLGTEFTVTAPDGETERFSMKLIGAHNVINVMGAIAVANRFGIALKDLRIPVRRLRPVQHRMEMKENGNVTIIDDAFNSNPIGSKAAVETLALFDGTRILITPGMVELGADEAEYNRKFGTYAADCCDWILLVGRKHTEPILEGILSKGFPEKHCMVFDKVEDAINFAYGIRTAEGAHKYILLENDLPDNY